jgi:Doubled CXXCH motif (Paired_CXXCH_1)
MRWHSDLLVLVCCLSAASAAAAAESCVTCHPDVKAAYADSVHAKEFGCTGCHGGDPTVLDTSAHATAKGYIGKPARTAIPALCASCHADPNRMKPFGLPTDQYAQYQTSEHGLRLAKGDTRVAVCTDCHGTHRILRPAEPLSSVYRRNVPATCGRCHADKRLMAAYNLPADQLDKFRGSVHGVALFVDDHPSAPTCATCHGAHGASAPHVRSIQAVCGHCHARTREYFNAGPHRRAADAGKMSECISCHGYHDTAPPSRALFDTACGRCHPAGSSERRAAEKLKTLLSRTQESLDLARTDLAQTQVQFPTVARYRPRLQEARAYYLEALPVQHSLAVDRVDDLTRNARSIAEEVQAATLGVRQESRLRDLVLALAWLFILFTVAVAAAFARERRRRHRTAAPEPPVRPLP